MIIRCNILPACVLPLGFMLYLLKDKIEIWLESWLQKHRMGKINES